MTRTYQKRESRDSQKRIPPGKPRRQLVVEGLKPSERGYWAKPEQFDELMDGGYSFVRKEGVSVGDDGKGNTDLGSIVSKVGDKSTGDRLYLLKIPKEWYEENQREKQREIEEKERNALKPAENQYEADGNSSKNDFRR